MKNITKRKDNKYDVIGIFYSKQERKWKAYINSDKVRYHIGTFETELEAIHARLTKERELYGAESSQSHLFEKYNIGSSII
jgi:hypothetical protein